jgi:hypothetical protein
MQEIKLPSGLEPRLQRRYEKLVMSHLRAASPLAAGVKSLPDKGKAFAATQGAWRFHNNERVTLPALIEPLRACGAQQVATTRAPFALLVHDWSKVALTHNADAGALTHQRDVGYELTTALLVSADDGAPLAPMELYCRTAEGLLSTRTHVREVSHVDQILPTMNASRDWGLSKPLLHVIDREADSVGHFRKWHQSGHKFLVRADDRQVLWNRQRTRLSVIRRALGRGRHFRQVGEKGGASYQGRPATLFLAETEVVLDRAAKKKINKRSTAIPGVALKLRLVLVQVRDAADRTVATWLLLSNAPREWATSEQLAWCYYWRWNIETYFKLLKTHGMHLEQWRQETGPAVARRLLVASMACVVVWQLQHTDTPEIREFKDALVRLSGRQTKADNPHTAPALLAGLGVLLPMLTLLEHTDLDTLKEFAKPLLFRASG